MTLLAIVAPVLFAALCLVSRDYVAADQRARRAEAQAFNYYRLAEAMAR